jgi:hypothetical protein
LVRKNLISNEDLESALRLQKAKSLKKPIGTILLEMGLITQDALEGEIRNHILLVVRDLLSWEKGSFHFELGKVITEDIVFSGGMNTDFLLLEGARLQDEEKERGGGGGFPSEPTPEKSVSPMGSLPPFSPTPETEEFHPVASPGPNPIQPLSMSPSKGPFTPSKPLYSPVTPSEIPLSDPPIGAKKNRKDLVLLTSMIEELSGPSTSSEITLLVLRYASELMNRAVVFLVRKDDIMGLGQFGVVLKEGGENEKVRSILIPLEGQSIFRDVVHKKISYRGQVDQGHWDSYLLEQLGGGKPLEVFAAPLMSDGKVIAILYGDNLPKQEPIMETEGLEAFIRVAGFAFGKAFLERKLHESKS